MRNGEKQESWPQFAYPNGCGHFAKEQLFGSDVKVSTPIGLPGGVSATEANMPEVKEAIKNGRTKWTFR